MYKLAIKSLDITKDNEPIATINFVPPDGISVKMLCDQDIDWVDLTRVLKQSLDLIDSYQGKQ